ncbi:hypothetical protein BT69DRAFT_1294190 [Atractiella rhizophila]|nr:hypothetical protein BT69DRAFT_1294190 [Atractiella rhizophila]
MGLGRAEVATEVAPEEGVIGEGGATAAASVFSFDLDLTCVRSAQTDVNGRTLEVLPAVWSEESVLFLREWERKRTGTSTSTSLSVLPVFFYFEEGRTLCQAFYAFYPKAMNMFCMSSSTLHVAPHVIGTNSMLPYFICSTQGWLEEAGEQLEYGKNHEGYWNAEKLAEQVEKKFIPVFERLHSEDQTLVIFDNLTGHAALAKDALNTKHMNVSSGGAQARLRDCWVVLEERNLWLPGLRGKCKKVADHRDDHKCCAERWLAAQPALLKQKPFVQEILERRGHCAIFLPKFHCELNFVEFFWGAMKRYIRENCDYTFEGLK